MSLPDSTANVSYQIQYNEDNDSMLACAPLLITQCFNCAALWVHGVVANETSHVLYYGYRALRVFCK